MLESATRPGNEVVVVHGAGPQIGAELARRGFPSNSSAAAASPAQRPSPSCAMSLVAVGAELAAALGPAAVSLVGDEIGLEARRIPELGLVGEPVPCRPAAVEALLAAGRIPVSRRSPSAR